MLLPHAYKVLFAEIAKVCATPVSTLVQDCVLTLTGEERFTKSFGPCANCPWPLNPHVHNEPSDCKAVTCVNPMLADVHDWLPFAAKLNDLNKTGWDFATTVKSPKAPAPLLPHNHKLPAVSIAEEFEIPEFIIDQDAKYPTCTGEDLFTVVPSPNCAEALPPHNHRLPTESTADECDAPALTFVNERVDDILTGEDLFTVVPSPSWPVALEPQLNIVLFDVITPNVCAIPAETKLNDSGVFTLTGLDLLMVVPSPSWPVEFKPQAYTVLFAKTPAVCELPTLTLINVSGSAIRTGVDLLMVVPSPSWPTVFVPHIYNALFDNNPAPVVLDSDA